MLKIVFIFLILVLFSCEKENVDCWVCKVDAVTMIEGIIVGTSSTFTYPCGFSAEDIFAFEERGTGIQKIDLLQSGFIIIKNIETITVTSCKRR